MSITIVSIQMNSQATWDVIEKTFPQINEDSLSLEITVSKPVTYTDKTAAIVAAKKIEELKHLPFISDRTGVITVVPFGESFYVIKMTHKNELLNHGGFNKIVKAIREAGVQAKKEKLILIC